MRRQKLNALFFLLFLFNYTYAQEYEQKTEITNILVENRTYGNEPIPVYVQIKNAGEQPLVFNDFEVKVATADFGEVNKLCVDKNISLLPGRTQTYTVIVPHLPSGDYVIYPQWFSRSFGREDLKSASVHIDNSVAHDIDFAVRSVQVLGGAMSEFNWADQEAGKPVLVVGSIRNMADHESQVNLTLNLYEWNKCENRDVVHSAAEPKMLPAKSASNFSFELTAPKKPASYEIELLVSKGGVIVSRAEAWVVTEGVSGRITNAALDRHAYRKGEKAAFYVSIVFGANESTNVSANLDYEILLKGRDVYAASEKISSPQSNSFSKRFSFVVPEDLEDFVLNVTVTDGLGNTLDDFVKYYGRKEFEQADSIGASIPSLADTNKALGISGSPYTLLVVALLLLAFLLWIKSRRKRGAG